MRKIIKTHGGRNLAILGIVSILIATATTAASLLVYRNSGDIYLDRSRPGYLPDEEEANEEAATTNTNFVYSDTGALDKTELQEYLDTLKSFNDRLDSLSNPYSPDPLSDESLGIPTSED